MVSELVNPKADGESSLKRATSSHSSPKITLVDGDSRGADKWKAWLSGEAGSAGDAWLLTVSSSIGQVMLVLPNATARVGMAYAIPIAIVTATLSLWTLYILVILYVERKAALAAKGLWYNEAGERKVVTQYHEVIGDLLGPWARWTVIVVIAFTLFGVCVAQIVASAADGLLLLRDHRQEYHKSQPSNMPLYSLCPLKAAKGLWYNEAGERKVVTQYHEVIGDLLGPWARWTVIVVIAFTLFGVCVAQIVASAADAYYFSETIDKRTWGLIWGGIMMVTPLLPSFRHFRILNIIGIFGTTFTAWYIVGVSVTHGNPNGNIHW
eukprot:jgi/Botrbrau1/23287/Bobra.0102s0029.1